MPLSASQIAWKNQNKAMSGAGDGSSATPDPDDGSDGSGAPPADPTAASPPAASPAAASPPAVSTPPASPPPAPPQGRSAADFYAQGHQDGLDGGMMICPKDADEAGEKSYDQGYAAGQKDRQKTSLVSRIEGDLAGGFDPKKEIDELRALDMDGILDVMEALKKDGQLEKFSGCTELLPPRIGTAILTIKPDLEAYWQEGVAKLAPPEREAVLKRVPEGSYKDPSGGPTTSPPSSPPPNAGLQGVAQLGGQAAKHYAGTLFVTNLKPNDPSQDKTLQLQVGLNDVLHPQDQSGVEVQVFAQWGYNVATKNMPTNLKTTMKPTTTNSAVAGVQVALVQAVSKLIQTQEFAQLTAGVAVTGGQASSQLQGSIGVQGALQLGGPWSIGVQGSLNVTGQQGSGLDTALAGTLFVQFTF